MAVLTGKVRELVAAYFLDDPRDFVLFLEDVTRRQALSEPELEGAWRDVLRALNGVAEAAQPLYQQR